jgi:SAM-dependent methyltransferase
MPSDEKLTRTRDFFGPKAATWEDRFPDDAPAYARAVADLAPPPGGVALDAGCGTGRALPFLREAVGPSGLVLGVDATPEMFAEATRRGRARLATLILTDASRLPLRAAAVDAVLAAGLVPHLADPAAGLRELARVTRPGGRLALFHPIGRATMAARQGHAPSDADTMAPPRLRALLDGSGWSLHEVDDAADRYLALAVRRQG